MEYAKDIILSVSYKKRDEIRTNASRMKNSIISLNRMLKKWTSVLINIVKNNKIFFIVGTALITLIVIDFILVDRFLKLFLTLYY